MPTHAFDRDPDDLAEYEASQLAADVRTVLSWALMHDALVRPEGEHVLRVEVECDELPPEIHAAATRCAPALTAALQHYASPSPMLTQVCVWWTFAFVDVGNTPGAIPQFLARKHHRAGQFGNTGVAELLALADLTMSPFGATDGPIS